VTPGPLDPVPVAPASAGDRLCLVSAGLLGPTPRARRVRRILQLAGLPPGLPLPNDGASAVGVWGRGGTAARGEALAERRGLPLVRLEDAWLRSVRPGRTGNPTLGLLIDRSGVHYDASRPSDLETLLARHPLDETGLIARARQGIARLIAADLSKYNIHETDLRAPAPGYVLIIDQTRGDAAVTHGGGTAAFGAMMSAAREAHPGARLLIRAHPETALGLRSGHFGPADGQFTDPRLSPWELLQGAIAVYTVSSQMGFEAILAGHRPWVFGTPFYAGWGLTEDALPLPRRGRRLTRAQLFAAAMLLYPVWYDPCRDRLCNFEAAVDQLEAATRAFREDRQGYVAVGMRLWKRPMLQGFFGTEGPVRFARGPLRTAGRRVMVWGAHTVENLPEGSLRIEDGPIRSRGLGAALVPALSLVRDDLGIYYDPARESRLERLVAMPLPPGGAERAERLAAALVAAGVTKYNVGADPLPQIPPGRRILVPGQVEDDASVRLGAGTVRGNLSLLEAVRAANPEAVILWKPHPDVEAGLRPGAVPAAQAARLADVTLTGTSAAAALSVADEVWTITSTLGFEALLRGLPVTCLGAPFYAGWGLTCDLGPVPERRRARPGLAGLVHAVLIAYPRYRDPVSGLPCPPEVIVERLAGEQALPGSPTLRVLAHLQGAVAGHAWIWRRGR
jgi:capsular polysaccharide export protein